MRRRVTIATIGAHVGEEVVLCGWLYNLRSGGKIRFLQIRDGSGMIQGVASKRDVSPETFDLIDTLTQESSIIVVGTAREDKRAPSGYELSVKEVHLFHRAAEYPITPKEHGTAFLMEHRHLWLRSAKQHALIRVRSTVEKACRDYMEEKGFTLIDSPIFTPAACEGTTTLFEVKYFEQLAYLTQSGQLYLEPACMSFGKVYCFGPTFRAEKSKTRRHLTEFWMIEPEVAWADLDEVMDLAEDFLCYIVARVLERCRPELQTLERDVSRLEKIVKPFPRVSYDDAVLRLRAKGVDFRWGGDFGGTDETLLTEDQEKPLMVHRFPAQVKAFYMKADPARPEVALGVDVLAPEGYGEVIGGGERMHDHDELLAKIQHEGLPQEAFQWYLDIRKYGTVPHAGFGMGIERCVAWLTGTTHVRETIPYPRTLYRIYP
ncbi:MAG: asparagine--tRNA ligase [Acidobacteriota bacterium]